jgi:hypothetical protein
LNAIHRICPNFSILSKRKCRGDDRVEKAQRR